MKELKVDLKPVLAKMEVFSKKRITGLMSGEYRSAFKGTGLEFDRYRIYDATTDDASRIDWKVSQRSRDLMVKEYVEERNANIVFLVDVSSSMSFGSAAKLKNEYAAELVATLAFAMIQTGDEVGLAMFSDRIVSRTRSATGNKQYYTIIKNISNPSLYEGAKNFEQVIKEMMAWLKTPTTIIIVSDFLGLDSGWEERFEVFAIKHEIICFIVRDPRDLELSKESGDVMVEDPYTGQTMLINTKKVADEYNKVTKADLKRLTETFKNYGAEFTLITTDMPFKKPIMAFFNQRSAMMR